jgi:DNA topoisomerase-1
MNLIVVESPTKAKTLGKFLGKDYKVIASMGHVRDLPKDRLGIDVNHDFQPAYQVMPDHKKIAVELKEEAKKAKRVILATDPDREGEAIAWHIAIILGGKNQKQQLERITFHEITESAIFAALKNPGTLNLRLVNAQQARRVLDRLVGYKLSPLLWSKVRRGLSAGRVQSVALRIMVEREREIERFKKEEYWSVTLKAKNPVLTDSSSQRQSVDFELISNNGVKYETSSSFDLYDGKYSVSKTSISSKEQVDLIINDINKYSIYISDIDRKAVRRSPLPPFTTSTLQQEIGRKLGYSAKKTMQLAQRLYENGFITYHRTDSVHLASEAVEKCRNFIGLEFGQNYIPDMPRAYQTKQKLAQEAHEAIRPTKSQDVQNTKLTVQNEIGRDAERVYDLIWKRFVACQMKDAEIERTTVIAMTNDDGYLFKTTGSVVTFSGFLKVYPEALEETKLPVFEKGKELVREEIVPVLHFTMPPPRYNEASLIATLEERGIGRPSTYAPTISTIQERQYVEKEEKKLKPNALGMAVNDFLVENFSDIDDMPFTAKMEDEFDEIAGGKKDWVPVIKEFFDPFSIRVQGIYKNANRVKIQTEETDEKCDVCGAAMIVRIGKFGKFLACSKFPECKHTKPLIKTLDIKCPDDSGFVVIKKTKKGKTFYGCSNYPNCKWASWNKPK